MTPASNFMRHSKIHIQRRKSVRKVFAIFLGASLLLLPAFKASGIYAEEAMGVTTKITHETLKYFVPGSRIIVSMGATDPEGVKLARCYFRAKNEANFVFVDMNIGGNDMYQGIIPAPSRNTEAIEYIILVVNEKNVVVRTPIIEVGLDANSSLPSWQTDDSGEQLAVKTELPGQPATVNGFSDSVKVDLVESVVRFGFVAEGIYLASQIAGQLGPASATWGGIVFPDSVKTPAIATATEVEGDLPARIAPKRGGLKFWHIALAVVATAGIAAAVILLLNRNNNDDDDEEDDLPGGTGEVKVTLQWYNCADLDLWVTDPCGRKIYFASSYSTCNGKTGELDVDSNAMCSYLNCSNPAENIYWVTAPSGSYKVQVNYYTPCSGSGSTSYKVTTIVKGNKKTYTGTISPYATNTVTTFTK
jgi:hypothetical protein